VPVVVVIPAPIAYIIVVVVKKFVVGFEVREFKKGGGYGM